MFRHLASRIRVFGIGARQFSNAASGIEVFSSRSLRVVDYPDGDVTLRCLHWKDDPDVVQSCAIVKENDFDHATFAFEIHEAFAERVKGDSCLILGGGCGSLARGLLEKNLARSVTCVERSSEVLDAAKYCFDLSPALMSQALRVVEEDAVEFVQRCEPFDTVLIDIAGFMSEHSVFFESSALRSLRAIARQRVMWNVMCTNASADEEIRLARAHFSRVSAEIVVPDEQYLVIADVSPVTR